MCSNPAEGRRRVAVLWLALALISGFLPAHAASSDPLVLPAPESPQEAWLVTFGPGDIYWQRFGHNAIWIREPAAYLDHSFNFGYFDFEQAHFLRRFVLGRMLYQSLAFPAARDFSLYAEEGRAVRARKLELTPAQYTRLRDHLLWHVQAENRDYLYDYYRDNCSTRVRDAIDLALEGALSRRYESEPARETFGAHTRSATRMDYWYYLGLQIVLGAPVERPVSRWDETFIPAVLDEVVAGFAPLAGRSVTLNDASSQTAAGRSPAGVAARYLLTAAALLLAAWLAARLAPGLRSAWPARAWVALVSAAGLVLLVLWAFTDHEVVGPNLNLLLFNPLFAGLLWARTVRVAGWLSVCLGVLALVLLPLGWQYNLDVIALVLPLNLGSAWRLGAFSRRPAQIAGRAG